MSLGRLFEYIGLKNWQLHFSDLIGSQLSYATTVNVARTKADPLTRPPHQVIPRRGPEIDVLEHWDLVAGSVFFYVEPRKSRRADPKAWNLRAPHSECGRCDVRCFPGAPKCPK